MLKHGQLSISGVQIKSILYFCTHEERNAVKQLKTTKTNRNTVIVAAKDAGTWHQIQGLMLRRMLVASDETLDEEGKSFSYCTIRLGRLIVQRDLFHTGSSSSIDPSIQDNGSRMRNRVGERGM